MNKTNAHRTPHGTFSGLSSAVAAAIEPVRAAVEAAIALHPLRRLDRMLSTARVRYDLRDLDDRMLKDIGVSRLDIEREIRRPFWDVDGERPNEIRSRYEKSR